MNRLYYIDNIRIFLSLLVIAHHTLIPYISGIDWFYIPSATVKMPFLEFIIFTFSSFRMGLYFFICGFFVPKSLDSRGSISFLKRKLVRLGIPILLILFIHLLLIEELNVGHLWFIEVLLIFSVAYVIIDCFSSMKIHISGNPTVISILVFGLFVTVFFMLFSFVSGHVAGYITHVEPAVIKNLPIYISMFCVGVLFYRCDWIEKLFLHLGIKMLVISMCLVFMSFCLFVNDYSIYYIMDFFKCLECVSICTTILVFFKNCCNKDSKLLKWFARNTYGVYLFHFYVLYLFQILFDTVLINVYLKIGVIVFLTVIVSNVLTWILRKIPYVSYVL